MNFFQNTDFNTFLLDNGFDSMNLRGKGAEENCSLPDILTFPNLMRKKAISSAIICFLISCYMFIYLAIVCDDYLVPAMERVCYTLRMPYDVAGATFLAFATSAPELFVNLIGTFVTEGDIGIGTIIGSSVFNTLAIPAVCGVLANVRTQLDWWPITRDTIWYLISILMMTLMLLDGVIYVYEGLILLGSYFIYLATLLIDRRIQKLCRKFEEEERTDELMLDDPMEREEEPLKSFRDHIFSFPKEKGVCSIIWWVVRYPSDLLLAVTIPSVRFFFLGTMLFATIWISIISYFLTWFLTIVGYNVGIPDSIMGLTFLAFGTSVPEAVSSYIVTKKEYGSMAMTNAISSNTVDIFICLGLPWSLKMLILKRDVIIGSSGLYITSIMLIISALILYFTFVISRFVMGKLVGWISLVMYVIFLIISLGLELYFLKKICDIEGADAHMVKLLSYFNS